MSMLASLRVCLVAGLMALMATAVYAGDVTLRNFTNPPGVTFNAGETSRLFAEDVNEIKDGIADGERGIFTQSVKLSPQTTDTLLTDNGRCIYRSDTGQMRCRLNGTNLNLLTTVGQTQLNKDGTCSPDDYIRIFTDGEKLQCRTPSQVRSDIGLANVTNDVQLKKASVEPTIQTETIASSGDANPASATWTIANSIIHATNNDPDGANVTLSESGAVNGKLVWILNAGTNPITLLQIANQAEFIGGVNRVLASGDSILIIYETDKWKEIATKASETTAGVARIANDSEADGGADNTTIMSPAKVATYYLKKDLSGNLQVADLPDFFPACSGVTSAPIGDACDFVGQCFVRTDAGAFQGLEYICHSVGAPPVTQNSFNSSFVEFGNGTNSQTADGPTALIMPSLAAPTTSGSNPNKTITLPLKDTKGFILPGTNATNASYQMTFRLYDMTHTIKSIACECFGTVSTAPQFKFCDGEDRGDDTCTTNLLSSTETDTLTCGTTITTDSTLNSAATNRAANAPITLQITTAGVAVDECWIQFSTER